MRLSELLSPGRVALAVALCALAILAWLLTARPVLLDVGTEISVLNPLRSRAPERIADAFLAAATKANCTPGLSERLCGSVRERPIPATHWQLVNRWDSARGVELFYKLTGEHEKPTGSKECLIGYIHLKRSGTTWEVLGYGHEPGACNGRLSWYP